MAVAWTPLESSKYICLDQDQWHYQELLQSAGRVYKQNTLKSVIVPESSELGAINALIFPVPYSIFIASSIVEASEQISLIARDVTHGIDYISNAYYSSIRSAIEQLSTAIVLLEYGGVEEKMQANAKPIHR